MRARAITILTLLLPLGLSGCTRDAGPGEAEAALVSAVESGPVGLRVETSAEALRTVDRVQVRIRATLEPQARLDALTFDPEAEGWTVIEDKREAAQVRPDGSTLHARTLTLEPFLEGSYTIPSVTASWTSGEQAGVAASDPLEIEVGSVLGQDDRLEIGELRAAPPEPAPPAANSVPAAVLATVVIALALGAVGVVAIVIARVRPGRRDPAREALDRLERAAGDARDPSGSCAQAASALRVIAPSPGDETRRLIDRLDDARFTPGDDARARSLLAGALEHARAALAAREARA